MKKKTAKKKTKARMKSKPKSKKSARPKAKAKTKATVKSKAKSKPKAKAKSAKKKSSAKGKAKISVIPPPNSTLLGRVEDYYAHVNVIALVLKSGVRVGDKIHVLGHTTNLEQVLDSMQINHQPVTEARPGDGVGIKINSRARRRDHVFLIRG